MAGKPGVFSYEAMKRIGRVVQRYESGKQDMPVVRLPRMGDEDSPIRLGKVEQQWLTGGGAISIPIWDTGTIGGPTVSATAETVMAGNMLFTIRSGSWVYLAQVEIAGDLLWHVIAASDTYDKATIGGADLSLHTNFNAGLNQALGHDTNGRLKWFTCTFSSGGNINYFGCS